MGVPEAVAGATTGDSQGKAYCRRITYTGYTRGIQGAYKGYTGGKAPAWEAIATG